MSIDSEDPVLVSIIRASGIIGVGRTTIYVLMADGDLESVKIGSRRLITMQSIRRLADKLLTAAKESRTGCGG